ncbi:MAG: CAP domain-containing protein, partial [Cyanobacteria bacterium P01_C01_bin.70]
VNGERQQRGLNPLTLNNQLDQVADQHSKNMAEQDFFGQRGPTGVSARERLVANGYEAQTVIQNIGGGYTSPERYFRDLMRSQTFRARLLNPNLTDMGLGYAAMPNDSGKVNYGRYWTQLLASPKVTSAVSGIPTSPLSVPTQSPIRGTNGNDVIKADKSDDWIQARAGRDIVYGRQGNDTIGGGAGDDQLLGQRGEDTLKGGKGNDHLRGGQGQDWLLGADVQVGLPGRHEHDVLTGGRDADTFVLGDQSWAYYSDGQANTTGLADYALLKDFSLAQGDKIQLHGEAKDYWLGATPRGVEKGQGIFLKTAGDDELIAVVQADESLTLQNDALTFV